MGLTLQVPPVFTACKMCRWTTQCSQTTTSPPGETDGLCSITESKVIRTEVEVARSWITSSPFPSSPKSTYATVSPPMAEPNRTLPAAGSISIGAAPVAASKTITAVFPGIMREKTIRLPLTSASWSRAGGKGGMAASVNVLKW